MGVFDGIHLGHQELLRRTQIAAARHGLAAVVLTFSQHPLSVLAPPFAPLPIHSPARKRQLLENSGIHHVMEVEFDLAFSHISPTRFVDDVLVGHCAVRHLVCGTDFRYGEAGAGEIGLLRTLSKRAPGFSIDVVDNVIHDGCVVRSTAVREAITMGDVDLAAEFLTRPHEITGRVAQGLARGRQIGFPTANLVIEGNPVIPKRGVYLTAVRRRGSNTTPTLYPAMTNIGFNPTFGLERLSIETHVLAFDDNLVGDGLEVHFLTRLRDEQKFSGVEALRQQLQRDRTTAETLLQTPKYQERIRRIPPALPDVSDGLL